MKLTRQALGYIFSSCDGSCYYCGVKLDPFGTWEVDHMNPREQGGADAFHNLVAACRKCNRSKGNRSVEQYREAIVKRITRHVAASTQAFTPFIAGLDQTAAKVLSLLQEAEQLCPQIDPVFSGEGCDLPRKNDPMFSEEFFNEAHDDDSSEVSM